MFIETDPPRANTEARSVTSTEAPGGFGELARAALIFLLAAFLLRAMAFVPAVIDSDEGLFLLQAREWLRGRWPLVAVWDMHPVGAPALIALGMAAFGESLFAVRLTGLLAVVATALALCSFLRVAGAPRRAALAAGLLYISLSVLFGGLTTATEILMTPFVAGALAIGMHGMVGALERGARPGWAALCAMGLLVGWALVVKPVAFPMGCLAFALFAFPAWWRGALSATRGLVMAAAYAGLCAAPTLLLGFAYWLNGGLDAFLDGSFYAPLRYSGDRMDMGFAWRQIGVATVILLWPTALALIALAFRAAWRPGSWYGRAAIASLFWWAVATAAIVGPGMYYQHYFLLWLPPLALLATLGAWRLVELLDSRHAALLMAGVVGVVAITAWQYEFAQRFQRGIGFHQPDPVQEVAAVIRREGARGDTVFVANYHTTVYFLVGAPLPTRYIFPGHITGPFFDVPADAMTEELARVLTAAPRFIVVDRGWWNVMHESAQEQIAQALHAHYAIIGRVQEERGEVEVWRRQP